MTITLAGHSSPTVGFEVPLEMLAACHLRVQDQCSTLLRLAPHIAREESELLPMAQRLLSDAKLDRIGLAMRMRRAVPGAPAHPTARTPDHSRGSANESTL